MKEKLNLISYSPDQIRSVVKLLDYSMKNMTCKFCNKKLKMKEVGLFVNSDYNKEVVCSDECCLVRFIAEGRKTKTNDDLEKKGDGGLE